MNDLDDTSLLREAQRKSVEVELTLLGEIRRLQAAYLELSTATLKAQTEQRDELASARQQRDRYAQAVVSEMEDVRAENAQLKSELTQAIETQRRMSDEHAAALELASTELRVENASLTAQLRAIVEHLHMVDSDRAQLAIDREANSVAQIAKLQELEVALKEKSAQQQDAVLARDAMHTALEVGRQKIRDLEARLKKAESDASLKQTLTSLMSVLAVPPQSRNMPEAASEEEEDESRAAVMIRGSEFFDESWYMQTYGGHVGDTDPAEHYLNIGFKLNFQPSLFFDGNRYLREYVDVAAIGENPLYHYIKNGMAEGRGAWPVEETVD